MQITSNQVYHKTTDRFPAFQLFVLALCRIAEPIALTSIFPYAFPMVKRFLGDDNPNNALYTGILISSFSLAEAVTGVFWGACSDKVGRKPVLLLGMFGTMVSLLMTGIAKSFTFALCARLFGGMLNGNIGVIQTMVGELVTNPDHEPRAFAIMPFVWCIGSIIGPAIAGLTSNSSVFPDYPYLVPNLIGSALLLFGMLIGFFFLEETRSLDHALVEEEKPLLVSSESAPRHDTEQLSRTESYGTFNWVQVDQCESPTYNPNTYPFPPTLEKKRPDKAFSKKVLILVSALCLYCYHAMCYDHLLPIFLQDERSNDYTSLEGNLFNTSGGIGMETYDVGIVMAINGLIALLIQGIVFPIMTDLLGVWHTFMLVTILHPIAYFIVPYIALLPPNLLMPGIYTCLLVRNIFCIPAYPILLILIKEAAAPRHLGRVNGLAASAGAIARMLAPPVGGLLYGWGTRMGFAGLAWWVTGFCAVGGAVQTLWIRRKRDVKAVVVPPFAAPAETETA